MNKLSSVYAIESAAFPGIFLRLDARGLTTWHVAGGGIANCQFGNYYWERFILWSLNEAEHIYAIGSVSFPDVYLRLDGTGVTPQDGPGGVVNAQVGYYDYEQFVITKVVGQPDPNLVTIASVAFPNVYLRLNGTGVTTRTVPGGGVVNAQFGHYDWEKFRLHPL